MQTRKLAGRRGGAVQSELDTSARVGKAQRSVQVRLAGSVRPDDDGDLSEVDRHVLEGPIPLYVASTQSHRSHGTHRQRTGPARLSSPRRE